MNDFKIPRKKTNHFFFFSPGPGYLAFISTITNNLDPESPVAMAFLSHIIDRAALPSRETMSSVSPTIISKFHNTIIKKKQNRFHRLFTSFIHKPSKSGAKRDLKLNAAILWSLLAEKFAGEMCLLLYQPDVSDLLTTSVMNKQEDVMVRIFALLALEKFALTGKKQKSKRCMTLWKSKDSIVGVVKERIMSHTEFNIRSILLSVLEECDQVNERIILEMNQEEKNKIIIIPSKGELRVEWAKYAQLRLCAKWALDHVFIDVKKVNQSIFSPSIWY
jgi:hypothetical protein